LSRLLRARLALLDDERRSLRRLQVRDKGGTKPKAGLKSRPTRL
jgi:hypothetical protein